MKGIVYAIEIGPYKQIGSTHNLKERIYHHKHLLEADKHYNRFLQRVYNKYKVFDVKVLYEFPTREEGYEMEQKLLDVHYQKPFYTMEHPKANGGSLKGNFNPNTGKKRDEHGKIIKAKWEKGDYSSRSTQQWKDNISKARTGKSYPKLQAACKKPKPHLYKKIECITESLTFDSLKEAAQHYKLLPGNISQSIKLAKSIGEKKVGKSLTFRYLS